MWIATCVYHIADGAAMLLDGCASPRDSRAAPGRVPELPFRRVQTVE